MTFTDKIKEIADIARNMSMRSALIAGFAALIALLGIYTVHTSHKQQRSIEELQEQLALLNTSQEELATNWSDIIPDKSQDNGVLQGILEQNENEIQRREQLIAKMTAQLKAINDKKFPTMQIAKEIAAQYPQMLSLTLARGELADVLLFNEEKAKNPREEIIAIIKMSEPVSPEETEKLQKWLAIRLNVPSIKIIAEQ